MAFKHRLRPGDERLFVDENDDDVTTTIAGANGFETVFDLVPDTDIYYWLLQSGHPQLGEQGDLRLRMQLPQEGGGSTEIGDDAEIRVIVRPPRPDDPGDRISRVFTYREFSQTTQFDNEDVVRLNLSKDYKVGESRHIEVQVDNSTNGNDVDLSQSGGFIQLEAVRGTE